MIDFLTPPSLMAKEQIESLLPRVDAIIEWAKGVKDYALEKAIEGQTYKGYKLVNSKSNRKFIDKDKVAQILLKNGYSADVIFEKKLLGITKLETILTKPKFDKLLQKQITSESSLQLVLETDPREAYIKQNNEKA